MGISFLYPVFLFALFAALIPVIIHLFNFRRYKIVYFSNLKFLQNLQNQTQSTSNLKHLLILICRILVIIFLVFAFAQPFIPSSKSIKFQNQNIVSIYIDNSFSMDAESKYGKMIEIAKKKSKDITDAYSSDTKFLLITNDYNSKHRKPVNKTQFLEYLSEISVCPETRNLSEIILKQQDLISNELIDNKKNIFYLISDFQKNTSDFKNIKIDTNVAFQLLPMNSQAVNNLYVDSCWFETPVRKLNQEEDLFVKIVNNSDESYRDIPIKLFINDTLKSLANFNVSENSSQTIKLTYKNLYSGIIKGKIEITDYPIIYDNTFYFSYTLADKIKLLVINQEKDNKYIDALFQDDTYIELKNYKDDNLDYSIFSNYNIIILNELKEISSGLLQELKNFISSGGFLMVIPNIDADIQSYNNFLNTLKLNYITEIDTHKTKISNINYECNILKNVFKKKENNIEFPAIYKHFILSNLTQLNNEIILSTEKTHSILCAYPFQKGKVYLFAMPLNDKYTNFVKHPFFVPVIYNIVLNSLNENKIYYIIGQNESLEIKNDEHDGENIYHIKNPNKSFDFIPEQKYDNANIKLYLHQNIRLSDNYFISFKNQILKSVSFNYNRKESDLKFYSKKEISDMLKNQGIYNFSFLDINDKYLTKTIKEFDQGTKLWKLFIALALLFLGIEIILLRLFIPMKKKNAKI